MLLSIYHDDTINNHHCDTFGVLVRIVKIGAVGNPLGVEENEIGGVALDDCAAPHKSKRRSCAACHLVHSLRQAEKIEISGVMPQNTRKRSVKSGMRLALPCDSVRCDARAVGADHDERICEDRPHVVLRHRAHQYPGGAAIGDDQVTGDIEGFLAALAGEVVDRLPGCR